MLSQILALLKEAFIFLVYELGRKNGQDKAETDAIKRALDDANMVYPAREQVKNEGEILKNINPNNWVDLNRERELRQSIKDPKPVNKAP